MSKSAQMNTTQPEDWVQAFTKQASIEGLTLSQWVGQACLRSLPFDDEAQWSQAAVLDAYGLSSRGLRGRSKATTGGPSGTPHSL